MPRGRGPWSVPAGADAVTPEPLPATLPAFAFANRFDQSLAERGPPAIFTVDADGELRLSIDRTREVLEAAPPGPLPAEWCHCLGRDRATGWVQYLLITSPALLPCVPRSDLRRFPTQDAAAAALAALGPLPLLPAPWPETEPG